MFLPVHGLENTFPKFRLPSLRLATFLHMVIPCFPKPVSQISRPVFMMKRKEVRLLQGTLASCFEKTVHPPKCDSGKKVCCCRWVTILTVNIVIFITQQLLVASQMQGAFTQCSFEWEHHQWWIFQLAMFDCQRATSYEDV